MRLKHNQKGFTLIELLIVIGILATLAAVAIFGQGEEEANQTELSNIQAAMDAMLAQNGLKYVEERLAPGTDDFSALPTGGALTLPEPLYPEFLRFGNADNPTKCLYTWDTSGQLEQSSCS